MIGNGLTDQQQAYVELLAAILGSVALISLPSAISGQLPIWVPVIFVMCGGISKALQQFAGDRAAQSTVLQSIQTLRPVLENFFAMPVDQQQIILVAVKNNLPALLSLLGAKQ